MACRNNYPLDLCAGLDYTRETGLHDVYPNIPMIGWVNGLLPMMDVMVLSQASAEKPSGPWVGASPVNAELYFGDVVFPGMQKVEG